MESEHLLAHIEPHTEYVAVTRGEGDHLVRNHLDVAARAALYVMDEVLRRASVHAYNSERAVGARVEDGGALHFAAIPLALR